MSQRLILPGEQRDNRGSNGTETGNADAQRRQHGCKAREAGWKTTKSGGRTAFCPIFAPRAMPRGAPVSARTCGRSISLPKSAYAPDSPTSYGADLTASSFVAAIGAVPLGIFIAQRYSTPAQRDAVIGAGIAATHYVGMAALKSGGKKSALLLVANGQGEVRFVALGLP